MKQQLCSPNQLLAAAREHMLDGREPVCHDDWMQVMNFMAYNVASEAAEPACQLLAVIFNMPLNDREIKSVVEFQLARKTA